MELFGRRQEEHTSLYPDFLGIGAQKAGTTWLSRNLQAHPEVWMPPIKEIHYFDERIHDPANIVPRLSRKLFGRRDIDRRWRRQVRARTRKHLRRFSKKRFFSEDFLWDLKYYMGTPSDEWYSSLLRPGKGFTVGEITPAYSLLEPEVITRVHKLMPQAKLVFMMRNPVERAWSQAVMRFDKTGQKPMDSVTDRQFHRTFDSIGSRLRTDYLRTLKNWGTFYAEDRIFVGFLEDVHFFPEELLSRLYTFLGVDPYFKPPSLNEKVHSRSAGKIPTSVATHLAGVYREETALLAERFGGYATFWLYCAQRLINDPPSEEHVPYPLWERPLWDEWEGSREIIMQSGELSSFRPAP